MRTPGRSVAFAFFMMFLIPAAATSFDRDYRERSKEAAYRAGFNDGYRDGLHRGEFDSRAHLRSNYHSWEYDRAGGRYERAFGHDSGRYRKGYKEGYRQGYRDGYRRIGFPRYYPRFR